MTDDPLLRANDDTISQVRQEIAKAVENLNRAVEGMHRLGGLVDEVLTTRMAELRKPDDDS